MADTTHNVTIKATLDTSTNDSQGRAGSPSGSGSSSSSFTGLAAAGLSVAKSMSLIRLGFTSLYGKLQEINARLAVTSTLLYKANLNKFTDDFKKLYASLSEGLAEMGRMADKTAEKLDDELSNLSDTLEDSSKNIENAEKAKADSTKRATQAQDRHTQATNRATQAAQQQASTFERSMTNFMKWSLVSQAAGNISRNFGELAQLAPRQSEENLYKWISRIGHVLAAIGVGAGAGAGIGATAGSVTGPGTLISTAGGAIIGAGFGLYSGINDELNKFTKEKEDETNELSDLAQSATALAKSQSDMRKSIQKTIEKINRDIYDNVIFETAPDQLESTLTTLEENIQLITKDISDLNSKFIQGKISLEDYNETMEDMQDKLSREKSLRDELSTRYEREQDREISEIQRQTQNFDYISELLYKQIELGKQEANSKVVRDGTWEQVLQALAEQNQLNLFEQSRSKGFFARMQDANFKQDWLAYDEAKMEFEESQRNLAFGLQMRSGLTSTLQEIFKEMMTYKGLNIRDFGSLAALGGFGSTSVLGDPMLDLQREQNRILGEMLRTIRDQDNSARYL